MILVLGIIVVILHGNKLHFNGAIPGLVLLVISKVTSGIGEGDGYIFIFAGLLFGVTALVYIMVISFMLSGMYALAAKFIKKQDNTFSFAFAPFILIGFVIYAFVGIKGIRI
ncbi:MAG: hypothetical protein Q4D29_11620 [Lachnospiraceae bacterium]|nr:hypothetical protein [Lachnospiraceae bacterium]